MHLFFLFFTRVVSSFFLVLPDTVTDSFEHRHLIHNTHTHTNVISPVEQGDT
jgi:hypothetical protein